MNEEREAILKWMKKGKLYKNGKRKGSNKKMNEEREAIKNEWRKGIWQNVYWKNKQKKRKKWNKNIF